MWHISTENEGQTMCQPDDLPAVAPFGRFGEVSP